MTFSPKSIPVYHCSTGHLQTLTWGNTVEHIAKPLEAICMENAITFPSIQFTDNR